MTLPPKQPENEEPTNVVENKQENGKEVEELEDEEMAEEDDPTLNSSEISPEEINDETVKKQEEKKKSFLNKMQTIIGITPGKSEGNKKRATLMSSPDGDTQVSQRQRRDSE